MRRTGKAYNYDAFRNARNLERKKVWYFQSMVLFSITRDAKVWYFQASNVGIIKYDDPYSAFKLCNSFPNLVIFYSQQNDLSTANMSTVNNIVVTSLIHILFTTEATFLHALDRAIKS